MAAIVCFSRMRRGGASWGSAMAVTVGNGSLSSLPESYGAVEIPPLTWIKCREKSRGDRGRGLHRAPLCDRGLLLGRGRRPTNYCWRHHTPSFPAGCVKKVFKKA